jgi:hypothetical protein
MNNRKKALCFLVLVLIAFSGAFAVNMFNTAPIAEPLDIGQPVNQYGVAAAATSTALGEGTNNVTNTRGTLGSAQYMLAGAYETYYLVLNVSDADDAIEILNVTAEFVVSAALGTSKFGFLAVTTGVTVAVTELSTGASNVRLIAGSTNVTTATTQNITIPFKLEWALGSVTDLDINVTVYEAAASSELTKNTNIDVIGTLDLSDTTMFTLAEYKTGEAFGTIGLTYHYTGLTTIYPLAAETDFYVSMAAVTAEGIGARAWVSTAYAEGTGIASFNDIIAPESNTIQTLTFTEYAVVQAGGYTGTDLVSGTHTDTVIINPSANTDGRTTRDDDGISSPFNSFEGFVLIGMASIIVIGGGVYITRKGSSTSTRRRSTRKRTTKKSNKRRRKK